MDTKTTLAILFCLAALVWSSFTIGCNYAQEKARFSQPAELPCTFTMMYNGVERHEIQTMCKVQR